MGPRSKSLEPRRNRDGAEIQIAVHGRRGASMGSSCSPTTPTMAFGWTLTARMMPSLEPVSTVSSSNITIASTDCGQALAECERRTHAASSPRGHGPASRQS